MIQFIILEDFIKPSSPCKSNTCKRNFKNFGRSKLKEDFYKINWDKVIHENDNNINDAFNCFYKTLHEILDHHAPLIKITKKEQTLHLKPWINKEIQYLMRKRDKLFQNYCVCKDLIQKNIIHDEFKKLRNIVTYKTRKSKKDYLKTYFEKNKNDISLIWKGIRQLTTLKYKSKRQFSIINVKHKNVPNPKNIANAFNNIFTNTGHSLSNLAIVSLNLERNSKIFIITPRTHDEVRKLTSQLNNRKALGPTSIPVTIIKDNISVLVIPLTLILNQSFEQGIFPEILKITVSNYCPISLLSIFSKIFEKAMYHRIYSFLCKYKLINTNEFGFRSNHSTEHTLISLIETIKKSLHNDEIVCGVFIDLQKAFDTVNHEDLLEKLNHYGIRSKENDWFRFFLSNRRQYMSINGFFSQTKIVQCDAPQDSTLGPLLFLIYINDLNNALDKCIVHHFAEKKILFVNKCPSEISCVMNNEIKLLTNWLRANKLSFTESKIKL